MSDEAQTQEELTETSGLPLGLKIVMYVVLTAALLGLVFALVGTAASNVEKVTDSKTVSSILHETKIDEPGGQSILTVLKDQNVRALYADDFFVEDEWMKFSNMEKKYADASYAETLASLQKQADSINSSDFKTQANIFVDMYRDNVKSDIVDLNRTNSNFVTVVINTELTCKAVKAGASAADYINDWEVENSLSGEYLELSKMPKAEKDEVLAVAEKAMKGAVAVGANHLCGSSS